MKKCKNKNEELIFHSFWIFSQKILKDSHFNPTFKPMLLQKVKKTITNH